MNHSDSMDSDINISLETIMTNMLWYLLKNT